MAMATRSRRARMHRDRLGGVKLDPVAPRRQDRLDDAEELGLTDERTLLEALPLDDHVGQPDQKVGCDAQGPEPHEQLHRARGERRPLHRVQEGIGLRHGLRDDEEQHDVGDHADDDTDRTEQVACNDSRQCRLDRLTDVDGEEQRVHPQGRLLGEPRERLSGSNTLFQQRRRTRFGHLRQAHLGECEKDEDDEEHDDGNCHPRDLRRRQRGRFH